MAELVRFLREKRKHDAEKVSSGNAPSLQAPEKKLKLVFNNEPSDIPSELWMTHILPLFDSKELIILRQLEKRFQNFCSTILNSRITENYESVYLSESECESFHPEQMNQKMPLGIVLFMNSVFNSKQMLMKMIELSSCLTNLELKINSISTIDSKTLCQLYNLKRLTLCSTALNDEISSDIINFTKLTLTQHFDRMEFVNLNLVGTFECTSQNLSFDKCFFDVNTNMSFHTKSVKIRSGSGYARHWKQVHTLYLLKDAHLEWTPEIYVIPKLYSEVIQTNFMGVIQISNSFHWSSIIPNPTKILILSSSEHVEMDDTVEYLNLECAIICRPASEFDANLFLGCAHHCGLLMYAGQQFLSVVYNGNSGSRILSRYHKIKYKYLIDYFQKHYNGSSLDNFDLESFELPPAVTRLDTVLDDD
jgi:hypothetical protein